MTGTNRQTIIRFYTDDERTEYVEKSEEIIENTLTIEEILTDGELTFGVPCSNRFECQIVNDIQVTRKQTVYVYQIIDDDLDNPVDLFYGKVDSAIADASGYFLTVTCYDRLYFMRNKSVRKWWKKYWKDDTHDFTIKGIREAFLTKYKFNFDDVTLFNDSRKLKKPLEFNTITFEELLTHLCAINACIPNMKRGGGLEFIELSNEVKHIFTEDEIELENCEFEWFDTPIIQGVTVESDTAVASTDDEESEDEVENMFYLPYNIFFNGKKPETMQLRAQEYLDKIKHISYRPFKAKMIISDLDFHLGDRVQIEALYNGEPITYYSYILKNTLSGPLLVEQEVGADGEIEFTVPDIQKDDNAPAQITKSLNDTESEEDAGSLEMQSDSLIPSNTSMKIGSIKNQLKAVYAEHFYLNGEEIGKKINYSTLEQDTGILWVTGAHIYQKTIDIGGLPNTGTKTLSLIIPANAIIIDIFAVLGNTKQTFIDANRLVDIKFKNGDLVITTKTDVSDFVYNYLTVFYYKKKGAGSVDISPFLDYLTSHQNQEICRYYNTFSSIGTYEYVGIREITNTGFRWREGGAYGCMIRLDIGTHCQPIKLLPNTKYRVTFNATRVVESGGYSNPSIVELLLSPNRQSGFFSRGGIIINDTPISGHLVNGAVFTTENYTDYYMTFDTRSGAGWYDTTIEDIAITLVDEKEYDVDDQIIDSNIASQDKAGWVKPDGNTITVDEDGTIHAVGAIADIPIASETTLGGIKVGDNLEISEDGTLSATGGGSGTLRREYLTLADWKIRKQSGTLEENVDYITTDETGENSGEGNIYSLEERPIGTWVNGKTIYQKTFSNLTFEESSAWYTSAQHNIDNLDNIIDYDYTLKNRLNQFCLGNIMFQIANTQFSLIITSASILTKITSVDDNWKSGTFNLTLRYTKTTD